MSTEGVDYSRGGIPSPASLKAAGKSFVGRYAVDDKSPNGRGITGPEYRTFAASGIDVFLYWEANEAWMLGGFEAGASAARNAVLNIESAGMPVGMPVYYSHDIEPQPEHYAAIDDCLRGAASIVGHERVGLYGGYDIIAHCAVSGTADWFCQTYAWEYGRGVHPSSHLYQYDNVGNYIDTVDCDLVRAIKPRYGQASSFVTPNYPDKRVPAPDKMTAQGHPLAANKNRRFECTQGGRFKTGPSNDAPNATPSPYKAGRTYTFDFSTIVDGSVWLVSRAGSWAPAKNFT